MIAALDHDHITYALQWIATHAHYVLFWLVPSPLVRRKKVVMEILAHLPLVSIFGTLLAQAEDPAGPVHSAVKAAVNLVGNDTEKKLAADDAAWSDLVTFIKAGVALGERIKQDVA